MRPIAWWHFQWPWWTHNPVFKVTAFFAVESEKKWRVLNTKLLLHKRKLPIVWHGTMFGDLDWPLNASRRFVSIRWASCFSYVALYPEDEDVDAILSRWQSKMTREVAFSGPKFSISAHFNWAFPMTLRTPNPVFKVTVFLKSNIEH